MQLLTGTVHIWLYSIHSAVALTLVSVVLTADGGKAHTQVAQGKGRHILCWTEKSVTKMQRYVCSLQGFSVVV